MKENIIQRRSYEFAISIVKLVRKFPRSREGFIIGNQILKSGTSIGANVEEALGAYSRQDFCHKMSIALKEARESCYWLKLVKDCNIIGEDVDSLLKASTELRKILTSIVKTTQKPEM